MASRGATVEGTDGRDFLHREQVATQYQLSALNKSRLKFCIFLHFLLFFLLLAKLSSDILDRLDIFILEIEELYIPKPLFWEYWWCLTVPLSFLGLSATRKNNVKAMRIYMGGLVLFGLLPVIFAVFMFFSDFYKFLTTRSVEDVIVWQGYPVAVLWYVFFAMALQVHVFTMFFASKLINAWKTKGARKMK